MLTRDQILAASDLKTEIVDVPEWGGQVTVRTMTGAEKDEWEERLLAGSEEGSRKVTLKRIRATLLALTVVDESGKRLFADSDVERIAGKSAAAIDRVYEAASRLNRLSKQDVEELEKNSGSAPT